ncbi:glycosyl hydrolase 2 galactose-binding domain-containing protein [Undibacterium sp. RuRC25W]|uniref:glycosyl hydrolase 2 galactose-binding domain-containing protein n=1 Tax=Undibacterium sp. RuRC25W TaxID=3413047 RepID=UPI003BF43F55
MLSRTPDSHETHILIADWRMYITSPSSCSVPSELKQQQTPEWPAQVPCTAASALRDVGQFHYDECQFDARDIWFSCETDISEDCAFIHFDGLAGIVDVFWNDTLLVRYDNMFVRHSLDVQRHQLRGKGVLSLRFVALNTLLAERRPRPRWKTKLVEQQQLRWLRTSLIGRMPGWSPPVPAVGPYRDITIEQRRKLRLHHHHLQSKLMGTDGIVKATFVFDAHPHIQQIRLHVGDRTQELWIEKNTEGKLVASGELVLTDAQWWWPHTHGKPHLYTTFVEVISHHPSEQPSQFFSLGELGFRQIHVVQSNDDFHLHVNGVSVFCRGACWTPADFLSLNADEATQKAMLTLARDAGMNMLRVVGTMVYENAAFYRLCDQLGILVWQDFMFANMDYPVSDLQFALNIQNEAEQFLQRTQMSPCIAVLCGNSEIEQQAAMLGQPQERWCNTFFAETLPQLCHELRSDALYWPSSPSGGVMPFQVDAGVAHYFGVGAYLRPLDDARRSGVRFTSECLGFSNMPEENLIDGLLANGVVPGPHPDWKRRVPRDHGTGWDFEDIRDHYMASLYRVDPMRLRYAERERYQALARTTTGEVMAHTIHEWRRHGSSCHGALIWFWRDLWAGAGWGVIDALGQPKAAYYFLKRAMAPLSVFFTDEGLNGLALHIINDTAHDFSGEIELRLYKHGEVCIARARQEVTVSAHSSHMIRADAVLPYFLDTSYAYRFGPAGHHQAAVHLYQRGVDTPLDSDYHFTSGHDLPVERDLGISGTIIQDEKGELILSLQTVRLAQAICISAPGFSPDDNYFHLSPGVLKHVRLHAVTTDTVPKVSVMALNMQSSIKCPLNINPSLLE